MRQLLEREDTELIVCLTRRDIPHSIEHNIIYWKGDIVDCRFPDLGEFEFTDMIHGANEVNDLLQPDQMKYYYTIVEGTNRVLKWAATTGIERTLVLSSGAVARDTIYGRAKRQSEFLCKAYGLNAKIARIFSVIGPEMPLNGQYAAGRFVGMALKGEVRYYGGQSVRTYLDVTDCAKVLIEMLDKWPALHERDVAGSTMIKMFELANLVADVFRVPCLKIEGPDREDMYLPMSSVPQTLTLTQSLERIRDHYKEKMK